MSAQVQVSAAGGGAWWGAFPGFVPALRTTGNRTLSPPDPASAQAELVCEQVEHLIKGGPRRLAWLVDETQGQHRVVSV